MRLLNIYTLQFQEFFENEIPPYHILSHRWGRDEISYEEFCSERIPNKEGYRKVKDFCRFIRHRLKDPSLGLKSFGGRDEAHAVIVSDLSELTVHNGDREHGARPARAGGEWVWVDTCCIDKRSSAELTEAINSMFRWYAGSFECVVRLADVPSWRQFERRPPYDNTTKTSTSSFYGRHFDYVGQSGNDKLFPRIKLERIRTVKRILGDAYHYLEWSTWFTRGWTLQELLAPQIVVFCNAAWEILGHVCKDYGCTRTLATYGVHLTEVITNITKIPEPYLGGEVPLYGASIALRMSWASERTTTRTEDEAYCLLGLFNVNMPMVYGEGRKAFRRLQLEIIRRSTDQSIFAWSKGTSGAILPIFATSPASFVNCAGVKRVRQVGANPYAITNNGLEIRAELFEVPVSRLLGQNTYFILLACQNASETTLQIMLEQGQTRYFRVLAEDMAYRPREGERSLGKRVIYIDTGEEDTDEV